MKELEHLTYECHWTRLRVVDGDILGFDFISDPGILESPFSRYFEIMKKVGKPSLVGDSRK